MTYITAIDPGPTKSAFVRLEYNGDPRAVKLVDFGIRENEAMFELFHMANNCDVVVFEKIACYGMAVGAEVFETVFWTGRFYDHAHFAQIRTLERITRHQVKIQICRSAKANDANIRQALIDRWGGTPAIKKGGALYKVAKDVWAALAVGITWVELEGKAQ